MKQKCLAYLLLVCLLCAVFPIQLFAIDEIDRDNTKNIADKGFQEDRFVFREYEGDAAVSSQNTSGWTGCWPANRAAEADPLDANNKLAHLYHDNSFSLRKTMSFISDDYILGTTLVLTAPEEVSCSNIKLSLYGKTILELTYQGETDSYAYNVLGEKAGTVPTDSYVRLQMYVDLNEDATSATFKVLMQGKLNSPEGSCTYVAPDVATVAIGQEQYLNYTANASDSASHLYIDDTYIVYPGEFGTSTITQEKAGDTFQNYKLDSKVTVKMYHEPTPATFNVADVRLCNAAGEDVPYTSLTYSYAHPDTLIFDFSEDPLLPNTEYYVHFPQGVKDILGGEMYEKVAKFSTKSAPGDIPLLDLVSLPKEGFVMPDTWNTGYRCDYEELVPFGEKYPEFASGYDHVITEAIARKYNYEFSHFKGEGLLRVTATSPVYIHDFYWNGNMRNGRSGSPTSSKRLTIAWGEGTCTNELMARANVHLDDFIGGSNLTFTHCFVHDVPADMMKATYNQIISFNYFRDGGTKNPLAHSDGIQFYYGADHAAVTNMKYIGNRFDMPYLAYDHVANATIFMGSSVPLANVQIVGNWFNGGGYTLYLPANAKESNYYNIVVNHNKIGYGHVYGVNYAKGPNGIPDLESSGGSYINTGYSTMLETGSVVYFSGEAVKENRVFDIADMNGTTGAVMVNFANYMLMARGYRIEVKVLDTDGNVVTSATKEGEIRRYIPVREYNVPSNHEPADYIYPDSGKYATKLITLPDLPQNVEEYVTLTALPQDMTGYSISVSVYDTQGEDKLIRTSTLTDEISDNTRPNVEKYEVKFMSEGELVATKYVEMGESATPPTAPNKEGYTFVGWLGNYTNVQGNTTVTAQYEKLLVVTIVDVDGTILSKEYVKKGDSVFLPTPPTHENYEFLGWSSSGENIQADTTITARYEWITTEALKAFRIQVEALESISFDQFDVCFAALRKTEAMWNALENKEEMGADAIYGRFLARVNAYNQAIASVNETLVGAIRISCATLDRGQNQVALQAVYQSLK